MWKACNQKECCLCSQLFWPRSSGQRACAGQCQEEVRRARRSEQRKQRRKSDPVFKAEQDAHAKQWREQHLSDPIRRAEHYTKRKQRERTDQLAKTTRNVKAKQRRKDDLVWREKYNARVRQWRRERAKTDPIWRAKRNAIMRRLRKNDPEWIIKQRQYRLKCLETPKGEVQWLIKSRHELNKIRRMLREGIPQPQPQRASPSPSGE